MGGQCPRAARAANELLFGHSNSSLIDDAHGRSITVIFRCRGDPSKSSRCRLGGRFDRHAVKALVRRPIRI
jgi:hypothetical protein